MTLSALVAQPADTRPTAVKITLAVVSRSDVWAGALVATVVPFCYMLLWWNRYLAPNSCAELLMMGTHSFDLLPYRDYQYQSPPGMPLFLGWLGAVFGPRLVVPWFIGVALNTVGAFVLYFLLWTSRGPPPRWWGPSPRWWSPRPTRGRRRSCTTKRR